MNNNQAEMSKNRCLPVVESYERDILSLWHHELVCLNEATFWEMLFLLLGNINDYVMHICSKYADLDRNNRTCRPGWEEVAECGYLTKVCKLIYLREILC